VEIGLEAIDIIDPNVKPLRLYRSGEPRHPTMNAPRVGVPIPPVGSSTWNRGSEDRRSDEALPGFGVAEVTGLASDFCGLDGPSIDRRRFAAAATNARKPAGRRGRGRVITHRTQKSAVNPLTRLASRSEIRRNYQSPHVEGPAATFDPCLIDL